MPVVESLIAERSLIQSIEYHIRYSVECGNRAATSGDFLRALALCINERLIDGMVRTERRCQKRKAKRLVYLSAEFLIGQSLRNNLFNLNLLQEAEEATKSYGFVFEDILDADGDAPLGNGGLGRLAACFMESLATLNMPAYGYGINYQFGLFKQEIENGFQKEKPDQWLNPEWLIERPLETCTIPLYGRVECGMDRTGSLNPMWVDWQVIVGVPNDIPIVGFGGDTVNYLRLYSARASNEFDMQIFNDGDYFRAVEQKVAMETVTKVLYPSDAFASGKELRLIQEYFMVACALRDTLRRYSSEHPHEGMEQFHEYVAFQMNDTHPSLVVAELMRMLVDECAMSWEAAWEVTQKTCGYTNHTLLPEALERWPVSLMQKLLPRHLSIIFEINHRFLEEVKTKFPGDEDRIVRMSIIDEAGEQQVRMAHLAMVGSHSINGVAALHSQLLRSRLVPDFSEMWPEKFNNKTNGVTHRRWLAGCNPHLGALITEIVGNEWHTDLARVGFLETQAEDEAFQERFRNAKRRNKEALSRLIHDREQIRVNPQSLFDVQIKRFHEYKRQLLNVLQIMNSYLSLIDEGVAPPISRTYIFAGKAAPGYMMAKLIIKLVNNVGNVINHDQRARDLMKVVFMRNYCVSLAEKIVPAADLSEQLSTAGLEASGTGNMKMTMNGALTIGTLDGANVEIREEVGPDNIYIFGMTAEEVQDRRATYNPRDCYAASPHVRRVIDALQSDRFSRSEKGIFGPIVDSLLLQGDTYFNLADLGSYVAAQQRVSADFADTRVWTRKAIVNVARSGKFSSDRTVSEYAKDIWTLESIAD